MTELNDEEIKELLKNPVEITEGATPATENLRLVDGEIIIDLETGEVRNLADYTE